MTDYKFATKALDLMPNVEELLRSKRLRLDMLGKVIFKWIEWLQSITRPVSNHCGSRNESVWGLKQS